MGVGMLIRWKNDTVERLVSKFRIPAIIALVAGLMLSFTLPKWFWTGFVGLAMALWIAASIVLALRERFKSRPFLATLRATPSGFYGMLLGHLGIAVFIVGVTLTSLYTVEKDLRMAPGETYQVAGYRFLFNGVEELSVDNYLATRGSFSVTLENSSFEADLFPEKRIYPVQKSPMTEAAIDAGFTRDLFIALGEPLDDQGSWAIRIYYKPFIRWIWLGAIIMALGGLFAASDRRYRQFSRSRVKVPVDGEATI